MNKIYKITLASLTLLILTFCHVHARTIKPSDLEASLTQLTIVDAPFKLCYTESSLWGEFTVNEDQSNFLEQKSKVKEKLFQLGIIADASKPLYVYTRKFAQTKGIDELCALADLVLNADGQLVVKGFCDGDLPESINQLVEKERLNKEKGILGLKVYTNILQLSNMFPYAGVMEDDALYFAADYMVTPRSEKSEGDSYSHSDEETKSNK